MAINLAEKYSEQVDEAIRNSLLSTAGVNNDVSFNNAQTVTIYSMDTAPLNDYNPEGGMQRYGEPVELQSSVQEIKMSQQKAFTFTIDKTYEVDSPEGVRNAGRALQRQIEQVIVPEIDRYRFMKLAELAGTKKYGEFDENTAYQAFVSANTAITEEEFPVENRVAFCSNSFIEALKMDTVHFTKATEIVQRNIVFNGMVGLCDGVAIIAVPKRRLPAGVSFIITHPVCAPAPVKLAEYKIHKDPPGIAGHLVEGLLYHDIFVLDKKKAAVCVYYGNLGSLEASFTDGTLTATGNTNGGSLVYKTGSSVTAPKLGDVLGTGWTEIPADGKVTIASGAKYCVALGNADGKCTAVSAVVTAA